MNVALLLEMVAQSEPGRHVVGTKAAAVTASELHDHARRAAGLFASRAVAHVALVDTNSEAVPVALFGAAMAGLPFVPINYRLADDQLRSLLVRLAPALVVGDAVEQRIGRVAGIEVLTRDDFVRAVSLAEPVIDATFVDPEQLAVLLFTSGTTGEPKAAVLRHRHLTSYVLGSVEWMNAAEEEAQLVSVPPYHIAGVSSVLSCLYAGRRIVYLPAFEPDAWLDTVVTEGITQAMLVPTMLGRILDRLEARHATMPSLRHISYGGGRMPLDLIERAMTRLPNVDFVNAYGLTETSSTVSVLGPDDHRQAFASADPAFRKRLSSVGRPLPTIELEIRGLDGETLLPGNRGEIYVRGDQVAGEYLGRSVADDGWFATNDGGHIDEAGFLYLDGRLDDVIIRGAENLSPAEIEDTLRSHPAISDAAVVGVPDPAWGEAVAAVVVVHDHACVSADELRDWVRARLRSARTPERIDFRSELPYTETGKLLRRVLRAELSDAAVPASKPA